MDNAASIVLAYALSFREASAQLSLLQDLAPLPTGGGNNMASSLIGLQPRLDDVGRRQDEQAKSISELRGRTAAVLERWYAVGVVGVGECWAEWEGRLDETEREVHRRERVKERRWNEI